MDKNTRIQILSEIEKGEDDINNQNPLSKKLIQATYNFLLNPQQDIEKIMSDISGFKAYGSELSGIFCLEGNRNTGKDTQINLLTSEGYDKKLVFVDRHIENPAKKILRTHSTDMFYGINPVVDTLLGAACRNATAHHAFTTLYEAGKPLMFNRYRDSFLNIQKSRLFQNKYTDNDLAEEFCNLCIAYMPEADLTFTLHIDQKETERRLKKYNNIEMTSDERKLSRQITKYFVNDQRKHVQNNGFYLIDGTQDKNYINRILKNEIDTFLSK